MQEHLGFLGAALVLSANLSLCVKIVRKKVRPSLATWIMWSVLGLLILGSQIAAGKPDPWGMVAATTGTILATVLLLVYGEKQWSRFDSQCVVLASVAAFVWHVTGPELGQVASLAALFTAGVPTVRNAWVSPQNESAMVWGIFTVGFALTVISVTDWNSYTNWIQPISSTVFNALVFSLALRSSKEGT